MARFKVIEYHDSLGNRRGWTVAALPNDYREGEPLPASHLSDRYFETEAEAYAELQRRSTEDAETASRPSASRLTK
jgi:hypothetical protein